MTAIDKGVVKVYVNNRAILPPELLGAGKGDPAAALRSVAYEYALTHRADIDSREDWQITHHIAGRLQQYVKRAMKARRERPYGTGASFRKATAEPEGQRKNGRTRITQAVTRTDSFVNHHSIDLYGRILPSDQLEFMVKHRRAGKPVYEDPAVIAKLHTRKPTRLEFWHEVCSETDRKKFRAQIAQAFAAGICDCADC